MERILLAYSGSLETSVAVPWLVESMHADVATLSLNFGQGAELDDVRERALASGATRAHVLDAREEFAREMVVRAVQARAVGEGRAPLASALTRPLLAKHLVAIARLEGSAAIAHGATGADADRIERAIHALEPEMRVIAVMRDWPATRDELMAYAQARGIPAPVSTDPSVTADLNLWGRTIRGGPLEQTWHEAPETAYTLTKSPDEAPETPAFVEIEIENGIPVKINGVSLSLVELLTSLETIAGAHGVGRGDVIEEDRDGVRTRVIYEAPAATVLHTAHAALQALVTPRHLARLIDTLGAAYAELINNGAWYSLTRDAIDAFVGAVQARVAGVVRVKLYKGECRVVGRRSPFSEAEGPRPSAMGDRVIG